MSENVTPEVSSTWASLARKELAQEKLNRKLWQPREARAAYASGDITKEELQNYFIERNLRRGLYEVPPVQLDAALERGFINEEQYRKAKWRAENPLSFYVTDFFQSGVHGAMKASKELLGSATDFANTISPVDFRPLKEDGTRMSGSEVVEQIFGTEQYAEDVFKPQTLAGEITSSISQFATGAAATAPLGGTALNAVNAALPKGAVFLSKLATNKYIRSAFNGALTDMTAFDPRDTGITDVLHEVPQLRPFVFDYLRTDNTDPLWEARLKKGLEGVLFGEAFEVTFRGIKLLKNALWHSKGNRKEVVEELVHALENETATPENIKFEREARAVAEKEFEVPQPKPEPKPELEVEVEAKPKSELDELTPVDNAAKQLETPKVDSDEAKVMGATNTERRIEAAQGVKILTNLAKKDAQLSNDVPHMIDSLTEHSPEKILNAVVTHGKQSAKRMAEMKGKEPFTKEVLKARSHPIIKELFTDADVDGRLTRIVDKLEDLPETLYAAGQVLSEVNNVVVKLAREVVENPNNLSEKELITKTLQAQELKVFSGKMQDFLEYGGTQVSRSLNQFKYAKEAGQYTDEVMAAMEGSTDLEVMRQNLKAVLLANEKGVTDAQMAKLLKRATEAGYTGRLLQFVQANLLWRPTTHIRNIKGNLEALAVDGYAAYVGSIWDGVRNKNIQAALREITEYNRGLYTGINNALKLTKDAEGKRMGTAYRAFSEGQVMRVGDRSKWEMEGKSYWGAGTLAGDAVFFPFKALSFMDEVFKSAAYEARKYHAIEVEANNMIEALGKNADDVKQFRVNNLVNPDNDIHEKAIEHMQKATFTEQTPAFIRTLNTGAFNSVNKFMGVMMSPERALGVTRGTANLFKMAFMPFMSVPINTTKWAVEHSPAALLSRKVRETMLKGSSRQKAELTARMSVGSFLTWYGYQTYMDGKAVGYIADSERDAMQAAGYMPWSFLEGKSTYSIMSENPIGFAISMGVMAGQVYDYLDLPRETSEELSDVLGRTAFTFASIPLEAPFLQSLQDTLKVVGGQRNISYWANQQTTKFVPFSSLLDEANKAFFDEYVKDTADKWDIVMQRLGFFANVADVAQDQLPMPKCHPVTGSPIKLKTWYDSLQSGDWRGITAMRERELVMSPLVQTMARLNVGIEPVRDKLKWKGGEMNITAKERYEYYQLVAETGIDEKLSQVVESDRFKEFARVAPDEAAKYLRRQVRAFHNKAKAEFFKRRDFAPQKEAKELRRLRAMGLAEPEVQNEKLYKFLTE